MHDLHVIAFMETWHDDFECVPIKRFRIFSLNVIENARLLPHRTNKDRLNYVNHGRIAVIARAGVAVAKVNLASSAKTFEHL